jgi:hypothetical protein
MIGTTAAKGAIAGALGAIANIAKAIATSQKNDSLVHFTSVLRVEPVTMIDAHLERVDYLPDALQTLLSMFCGYYLQAVACMCNVGQINVIRMLDTLNPSRDGALAATSAVDAINGKISVGMLSMESYEHGLPRVSQEANNSKSAMAFMRNTDTFVNAKSIHGSVDGNTKDLAKNFKHAHESVNLAVGKLLEVNIESNGNKAMFPVSVRLATAVVDGEVLTHILGASGQDNSWSERYHRWQAGDIAFWRDLVGCQDLIDEQKKLLMKDKTGAMAEVNRRRAVNSVAALTSGTPSVASASALIVLSEETAAQLERRNLGKFSDLSFRNKIMQNSLAMIIMVINRDYESVTIYTRDIQLPTKLSVRELKTANKGGGNDVGEILKAYRLGMSPAI